VPRRHKVLTHGQERLFHKVTSVSIHSFVEWLVTFSYILRPADVTDKAVNHIRCFAIDIAKDLILLSCRLAKEHLCVLQLVTRVASAVSNCKTLADSKFISLTTIQVGKKIKDRKKRVFASASYKHYTRRHKQKGLNLLFFNFLTSAWSLASS
jgi:hypothetical protein